MLEMQKGSSKICFALDYKHAERKFEDMIISKSGNRQPFPELRGDLKAMRYPAYVEPKIDGELNWWIHPSSDEGEVGYLINKSGKMRRDCKITWELNKNPALINTRLLGELHWGDGKSGDLYEFLKHQDDDELRFTVFDVDMPGTYVERRAWLEGQIPFDLKSHIRLVDKRLALSKEDVDHAYKIYTNSYEGIVVKSADSRLIMGPCPWVKLKHRETLVCKVWTISDTQERIEVITNNVCVGVKVPNKIKIYLRVGDDVEIEHQGVLSKGGLRHPVYIRKCGDI